MEWERLAAKAEEDAQRLLALERERVVAEEARLLADDET